MRCKKINAKKRFGKKGWSLRRGKRTFPQKVFFPSSSTDPYLEQSVFLFAQIQYLQLLVAPVAPQEVGKAEEQGYSLIKDFGAPGDGGCGPLTDDYQPDKNHIDKEIDKFNKNGGFDCAYAAYCIEQSLSFTISVKKSLCFSQRTGKLVIK